MPLDSLRIKGMRQKQNKTSGGITARLYELYGIRSLQQRDIWMNQLHPLAKLLVSVIFITVTVSFHKYDITPLAIMGIYLIFGFMLGELSLAEGLYRMRLILPLVIFVGIFNPFFDRAPIVVIGDITVTGGIISMISLVIKGFYAVLSAYILIATTSVEDICSALSFIHIPKPIITVILLIDRYFMIIGEEAATIMNAYSLRAPSQKGIQFRAWGTLVGQWLLRSMDRANRVYESMQLRGFKGELSGKKRPFTLEDILYVLIFAAVFFMIRSSSLIYTIGGLFVK